ncbi:MAG: hypothetical protein QM765_18435 [Myxococcales bacterium]
MNRFVFALLVVALGGGVFAVGCAVKSGHLFNDSPALSYRYHTDGWDSPEGHVLTVMSSGQVKIELEKTPDSPAVTLASTVPSRQVKRMIDALGLAGFYDMEAKCPHRPAAQEEGRRELTVYKHGKPLTVRALWSCAPDPELFQSLVDVLDEFAVGKRTSLDPAPNPTEEERLAMEAEAQLSSGGALVHLNAFGEGRTDRDPVLSVAVSRAGIAQVTFRRTHPTTLRTFVDSRSARVGVEEYTALKAKAEQLANLDLPRPTACTLTGRYFHLTWPRSKGQGEVPVVDDCPATPDIARELTADLLSLGERIARGERHASR